MTYAVPTLVVRDASQTDSACRTPQVAGVGEALSLIIDAPADRTSCPVRVDLFRHGGLIDAVVLYPGLS